MSNFFLKSGLLACFLFCGLIFYLYDQNRIIGDKNSLRLFELKAAQHLFSVPVIVYNRIPKTGSTTFVNAIAYDLCKENGFHAVYMNFSASKNRFVLNKISQISLVQNITSWVEIMPVLYHGHFAFIDFSRLGFHNPIYINLIREPFERFLSYYYFLRYGDDFRSSLKRTRAGNNETVDECFRLKEKDCDAKQMWVQIPYFCGTAHFCFDPGNEMALKQARWNLVNHYLLVGLTERMNDTIELLEHLIPSFFRGASEHFRSLNGTHNHMRNTIKKFRPSAEVESALKLSKYYKMERKFYDFAVSEFDFILHRLKSDRFSTNQFNYQKIKPTFI